MQSYTEIAGSQKVKDSRALLLDNDKTIMSGHSGTAFPTTNLQIGMRCFRTDLYKEYVYVAAGTWRLSKDLSADTVAGAFTTLSTTGTASFGGNTSVTGTLSASGNLIGIGATPAFVSDTADGTDNKYVSIGGGGAISEGRGAYISLGGNENTFNGTGGDVQITGGVATGALIKFRTAGVSVGSFSSTGLSITGALSASGNVTLSAGTANGVPYLNASKVLTTGTGLVFDGTNLGVGVAPAVRLDVQPATYAFGTTQAEVIRVRGNASGGTTTSPTSAGAIVWGNGTTTQAVINSIIDNPSASTRSALAISTNVAGTITEVGRFDSSGSLLLGQTSSTGERLQVTGNVKVTGAISASGDVTIAGVAKGLRVSNSETGYSNLSSAVLSAGGVRITSGAMNTSAKYVSPIVFGSTDTDFTTANPKWGAAITAYALEAFTSDTAGGMGLEFFASPTSPGSAQPTLTSLGTWTITGLSVTGAGSFTGDITQTQSSISSSIYDVVKYAGATNAKTQWKNTATGDWRQSLTLQMNTAQSDSAPVDVLTVSNSGNLGLGVTPSSASLPTFQSQWGLFCGNQEAHLAQNAHFNGGWKYTQSSVVTSRYSQVAGVHQWFTAPSGTAGNTISFTPAMTLDASGNILLGQTSSTGERLQVTGNAKITGNFDFTGTKSHWMGEVSMLGNATATTISNTTSYFKVAGTTSIANNMGFDDNGVSNRLRYTGATTRMFHIACSFSFSSTANNQNVEFAVAKNGTVITTSVQENKTAAGGDVQSTALHVVVSLAQNEYIEVFAKNLTSASNITCKNLNFFAMNAN